MTTDLPPNYRPPSYAQLLERLEQVKQMARDDNRALQKEVKRAGRYRQALEEIRFKAETIGDAFIIVEKALDPTSA